MRYLPGFGIHRLEKASVNFLRLRIGNFADIIYCRVSYTEREGERERAYRTRKYGEIIYHGVQSIGRNRKKKRVRVNAKR